MLERSGLVMLMKCTLMTSLQGCVDSKTVGKQSWERICEGQKAGGKLCKTMKNHESSFEGKETNCKEGLPPCPIDCKLSEWSTPRCYVGCGQTSTVYQTRIIEVQPAHGVSHVTDCVNQKMYVCISQVVRHVDQPKRRTLVMVIPAHAERVAMLGHPWFHWPMAK